MLTDCKEGSAMNGSDLSLELTAGHYENLYEVDL